MFNIRATGTHLAASGEDFLRGRFKNLPAKFDRLRYIAADGSGRRRRRASVPTIPRRTAILAFDWAVNGKKTKKKTNKKLQQNSIKTPAESGGSARRTDGRRMMWGGARHANTRLRRRRGRGRLRRRWRPVTIGFRTRRGAAADRHRGRRRRHRTDTRTKEQLISNGLGRRRRSWQDGWMDGWMAGRPAGYAAAARNGWIVRSLSPRAGAGTAVAAVWPKTPRKWYTVIPCAQHALARPAGRFFTIGGRWGEFLYIFCCGLAKITSFRSPALP